MSEPTHAEMIAYLASAFPRQTMNADLYENELADCPASLLAAGIRDVLRVPREWIPSVGDIRFAVAERILALPDEREAMQQVDARIEWARARSDGDKDAPELHPLVREAVNHVGGWHSLRASDRPEVARGQLLRYFREARAGLVRECAAKDMHNAEFVRDLKREFAKPITDVHPTERL